MRLIRNRIFGTWSHVDALRAVSQLGNLNYFTIRQCGDHRLAVDPSDLVIGRCVLATGNWQRAETERAIEFLHGQGMLRENAAFIDVGANIGTQSIYALLSGRFGRVLAIEPSPTHFDLCNVNMALNGFSDRAVCRNKAAGARAERLVLELNATNKGDNRLTDRTSAKSVGVDVETLDAILETEGMTAGEIGLVWIDVQGHEPFVIDGMARVLEAGIPQVIEFNPHLYGQEGRQRFVEKLAAHYDGFVDIGAESPSIQPFDTLARRTNPADILVVRKAIP